MNKEISVLFVCLGNICRSPTAEGILEKLNKTSKTDFISHSAATSGFHEGQAPDPRSQAAALRYGYDLSSQKSRPVVVEDFYIYDYIFAMDESNLENLKEMNPENGKAKLDLLLTYSNKNLSSLNIPDPYIERGGFDLVLDLIEDACAQFVKQVGG